MAYLTAGYILTFGEHKCRSESCTYKGVFGMPGKFLERQMVTVDSSVIFMIKPFVYMGNVTLL